MTEFCTVLPGHDKSFLNQRKLRVPITEGKIHDLQNKIHKAQIQ